MSPTLTGSPATARWLETTDREGRSPVRRLIGAASVLVSALLVPERVAGVVIAGPFPPSARKFVLLRRIRLRRDESRSARSAWSRRRSGQRMRGFVRFLRTALDDRREDTITEPAMPILVLTGEHDGFAPPTLGTPPR